MELLRKRKIFVGNLPPGVTEDELEDEFGSFGKVNYVELKDSVLGKPFAFVQFYDEKAAEAAVRHPGGVFLRGMKLRVAYCRGGYPGRDGSSAATVSDGAQFTIEIRGLPTSAKWNDVKDFVGGKGHRAKFVTMIGAGVATARFETYEGMKAALLGLDNVTMTKNGQTGRLEVIDMRKEAEGGRSRSRSRSPIGGVRR